MLCNKQSNHFLIIGVCVQMLECLASSFFLFTVAHIKLLVIIMLLRSYKQVKGKIKNFKLDRESKSKKSGKQGNS